MLFKLQKSNKKFGASLYQIYRTDTGHDFSLYFDYELLISLEMLVNVWECKHSFSKTVYYKIRYSLGLLQR